MTAGETAWACIGAAAGLCLIATYGWDAWHRPRTVRRFHATARQAARAPHTEADVQADLAAAREARQLVEQHAFDQAFSHIIAAEYPAGIPHQTRRTEDPQ